MAIVWVHPTIFSILTQNSKKQTYNNILLAQTNIYQTINLLYAICQKYQYLHFGGTKKLWPGETRHHHAERLNLPVNSAMFAVSVAKYPSKHEN